MLSIVNVALMRSYLPATEGNHRDFCSWAGVNTAWVREEKNSGHVVPPLLPTSHTQTFYLGAGDREEEVMGCPLP